ncbi:MAG: histone deacetylase family protein [Promethearchaeota archaeon]
MTTGFFYHKAFLKHDMGAGHPERPERLTAVMDFLQKQKAFNEDTLRLVSPRAATLAELERVHPKDYIDFIRTASDRESRFDADTRASKGSYNAAILAAGAGLKAWESINTGEIDNAFALVRPPGHHASENQARGFCLFSNVAVVARHITATVPDSRVLILDIDAHHGNGTQEILYEDPKTLYVGFHQHPRTLYPGYSGYVDELGEGPGRGYNVNFPLPPGASDASFLHALKTLFPPLAQQFQPTSILVSAGYDAHFRDYLTNLMISATGFFEISQLIMETAENTCNGKVIMFLEGGYDLQGLSESIYNTLIPMTGLGKAIHEKPPKEDPRVSQYVAKLLTEIKTILMPWWQIP